MAFLTIDSNRALMALYDLPRNIQPDAKAGYVFHLITFNPIESLEEFFLVFRPDADALISY
jgi:hypothetical protein